MLNRLIDILFDIVSLPAHAAYVANVQDDRDAEESYDDTQENGGYGPSDGPT
jgi:hypothetical protein